MFKFEIIDSRTVRDQEGQDHDVLESIAALPWVSQLCACWLPTSESNPESLMTGIQ